MAERWIRWDPTHKKWEVSVDGGAFIDLVETLVRSCLFSSGQYFTTTGQALTSYDYTFLADDLRVGDIIIVEGTVSLGGAISAGTKILTIQLGAGSTPVVFSTTSTLVNGLIIFRLVYRIRSTILAVVTGGGHLSSVAAPTWAETYTTNVGQNLNNIATNSQLLRMVGTHTGSNVETRMTDYSIFLFRAGGNAVVV